MFAIIRWCVGLMVLMVPIAAVPVSAGRIPITTFGGFEGYPSDVSAGLNLGLNGLSDDGSTVFGSVMWSSAGMGFWWTKPDGFHFLPQTPKYASYDGTVLAGESFYWSKSGGTKEVEFTVTGLSADGSTLIGNDSMGGLRWASNGSVQRLNFNPLAVSANGNVVAGDGGSRSLSRFGGRDVVLWTRDGGEKNLGNLASEENPHPETAAVWVSRDGRIVAGHQFLGGSPPQAVFISMDGASIREVAGEAISGGISGDGSVLYGSQFRNAARWTVGQSGEVVGGHGTMPGAGCHVVDSSFDGSIMVTSGMACSGACCIGFWSAELGGMRLKEALYLQGVAIDPQGEEFGSSTVFVSDSGRVFASDIQPFSNELPPSFWLVNLDAVPEPAVLTWIGLGLLALIFAAKQKTRIGVCVARRGTTVNCD